MPIVAVKFLLLYAIQGTRFAVTATCNPRTDIPTQKRRASPRMNQPAEIVLVRLSPEAVKVLVDAALSQCQKLHADEVLRDRQHVSDRHIVRSAGNVGAVQAYWSMNAVSTGCLNTIVQTIIYSFGIFKGHASIMQAGIVQMC